MNSLPQIQETQDDLVHQQSDVKPDEATERLRLPGIKTLHTKNLAAIGEALANVLKSRPNITSLTYKIGEYVEITYQPV